MPLFPVSKWTMPVSLEVVVGEEDLHSIQVVAVDLGRTWEVVVQVLVDVDLETSTLAVPYHYTKSPESHLEEATYPGQAVAGMVDNRAVVVDPSYVEAWVVGPSCVVEEDLESIQC